MPDSLLIVSLLSNEIDRNRSSLLITPVYEKTPRRLSKGPICQQKRRCYVSMRYTH